MLMISPDLPNEVVRQIALWVDVVGHLPNDIRALGITPSRIFSDGWDMIKARLGQIAVQSDEARAVIRGIRSASPDIG